VTASLASTGVDLDAAILLAYEDGQAGLVSCSLRGPTPGTARIIGTEGWIDVASRFHHPHTITLTRPDEEPRVIEDPPLGSGYSHELIEVRDCLRAGATESAVMPLRDSLAVQRLLNEACERLGVYHQDDTDFDLG